LLSASLTEIAAAQLNDSQRVTHRKIEEIASTARARRALSDADAARSYPALAFGSRRPYRFAIWDVDPSARRRVGKFV
jgi:hypothetical protein